MNMNSLGGVGGELGNGYDQVLIKKIPSSDMSHTCLCPYARRRSDCCCCCCEKKVCYKALLNEHVNSEGLDFIDTDLSQTEPNSYSANHIVESYHFP